METFYIIFVCIFCFLLFFNGCIINFVRDSTAAATATADDPSTLKLFALALIAVYEAVARIVPSVGDYSVVSWFIRILKKISDTLNVTK
jgi:hypothetical protein